MLEMLRCEITLMKCNYTTVQKVLGRFDKGMIASILLLCGNVTLLWLIFVINEDFFLCGFKSYIFNDFSCCVFC